MADAAYEKLPAEDLCHYFVVKMTMWRLGKDTMRNTCQPTGDDLEYRQLVSCYEFLGVRKNAIGSVIRTSEVRDELASQ
jgi:hypothetical protein